ncbi:hypothetical protein GCM10023063_12590 [Arthrobacter methylotrophus]
MPAALGKWAPAAILSDGTAGSFASSRLFEVPTPDPPAVMIFQSLSTLVQLVEAGNNRSTTAQFTSRSPPQTRNRALRHASHTAER